MKIVVDANIFIASFKKNSLTRKILMYPFIEFYSPDYLIEELEEHKEEIIKKAKIDEYTFKIILEILLENVVIVDHNNYKDMINSASSIVGDIDKDDIPYFALAIKINADGIWSYDKKLMNQNKVKIFTTKELINLIRI